MANHAPHHEHKSDAPKSIGCMVITCSDTRTAETDTSGYRIMHLLKDAGHEVVAYHLVKDEPSKIKAKIKAGVANKKIHNSIQCYLVFAERMFTNKACNFPVLHYRNFSDKTNILVDRHV